MHGRAEAFLLRISIAKSFSKIEHEKKAVGAKSTSRL